MYSNFLDNKELLLAPLSEPLTKRELEILYYQIDGLSNKEIAEQLIVSEETVKWHIKNLYNKLHVHRRSQAIARARALHL